MATALLALLGLPGMVQATPDNYLQHNQLNTNLVSLLDDEVSISFAGGDVDYSTLPSPLVAPYLNLYYGTFLLTGATAARNFKFPGACTFRRFFINASGQTITVKIGTSTGYALANGAAAMLYANGTDVFDGSGSGAVTSVAGRTGAVTLAYADIAGLGTAAEQNVADFLVAANDLSDVGSAATARTNLGLGTAAVLDVAASGNASSTQVVKGNDSRLGSSGVFVRTAYSGSGTIAATTNLAQANSGSAIALTLPAAAAYGCGPMWLMNINVGTATFGPAGADTIQGGSVAIASGGPSVMLVSDGVDNWATF